MDGPALIRTFLIFFAGGLLLTAAAISVFLIGNMVWLYCLDGNPNQACGDALFYGAATPIYGVIIGMGINFLPLAVGAVLAVTGRKLFRSLPLWYVIAILPACALHSIACGSGSMGNGTGLQSSPYGRSVSAMETEGSVAMRSESASTGAMPEKCGTQPAMVRSRPAAVAAALTGLARLSPTRTATCGQRDHAFRPHFAKAGWPRRAKHPQVSAPIGSAVTPAGRRNPAGAIATSS